MFKNMSFVISKLIKLSILPSWLILFIDLFLVQIISFFSLFLYKLIANTSVNQFLLIYLLTTIAVFLFSFFVFKTYKGVVRYSSHKDLIKIINAVFLAYIIFVGLNFIFIYFLVLFLLFLWAIMNHFLQIT